MDCARNVTVLVKSIANGTQLLPSVLSVSSPHGPPCDVVVFDFVPQLLRLLQSCGLKEYLHTFKNLVCFCFALVMEQCHCQTLDNNDNHEATNSQALQTVNSKRHIWYVCATAIHVRNPIPTSASVPRQKQAADNTKAFSLAS
jgi:hypothetical protein